MIWFLLILVLGLTIFSIVLFIIISRLQGRVAELIKEKEVISVRTSQTVREIRASFEVASAQALATYDQKVADLSIEAERIRQHYENEARKLIESRSAEVTQLMEELESLKVYTSLKDAEADVSIRLSMALTEAEALSNEAAALMQNAKDEGIKERAEAQSRVRAIQKEADALLAQARSDALRILADAERRAEEVGGDAFRSLRDKEVIEDALSAIRNAVEGYGDRYIVPTHSILDDLVENFGHTAAGESLRAARELSISMVESGGAATCDYVEANRRETAIRFVIVAFNGRVDAILSRSKHDNFGSLEQEIRDAFSLVNLHGQAFRNARILKPYLDARLAELRWATVVHELKKKEREEQRQIQEQIREEEKARREYERAIQEAAREEDAIRRAMEKARAEVAKASDDERMKFEAELMELNQRLIEAEAKNQRALSMAQQTRSGNVYIISNIGSFGEEVVKIGMTRRLEPFDRIKELGDASVPFGFDVHALIRSNDAPALERSLHTAFEEFRVNKVNYRKEFFRVPLVKIRELVTAQALEATFTMAAEAKEYRESLAVAKMSPEERQRFYESGILEEALKVEEAED